MTSLNVHQHINTTQNPGKQQIFALNKLQYEKKRWIINVVTEAVICNVEEEEDALVPAAARYVCETEAAESSWTTKHFCLHTSVWYWWLWWTVLVLNGGRPHRRCEATLKLHAPACGSADRWHTTCLLNVDLLRDEARFTATGTSFSLSQDVVQLSLEEMVPTVGLHPDTIT